MSILGDPGKAMAELMENPIILAKLPEVLAKCPLASMQVPACSIAPYLPPTKIEVDEVTRATLILRPILQEDIVKTINAIPKEEATTSKVPARPLTIEPMAPVVKARLETFSSPC